MDFGGSFGVLWRRKGLTLALLMLTLLVAVCAGVILPWKYNASVTETLLNSESSSQTLGGGNPYLSFDAAMVDMANLLAMKLTDNANTLALQQNGYTASFQAQVLSENPENEEPFIQITVNGSNKQAVASTLQGITTSLSVLLEQVQEGVPTKSRLSLQTISEVSMPVRSLSAKMKPIVGFLAVGLILTFLIPQAVEGSIARRRKIPSASPGDRPRARDLARRAESDRSHPNYAAETRSEPFQQQWPDQQVGDVFHGQHVSPMRQGGAVQSRSEYGVPGPNDGRYSETERRWLCSCRGIQP
jgi:hypothetical protein